MRNENYFSIHTAQLTWNLPFAAAQKTGLNGMQVYLRGSNLMMFAPNKERKQLNTDTAPQMRYFSLGISANF
jgi:hypothetical protein